MLELGGFVELPALGGCPLRGGLVRTEYLEVCQDVAGVSTRRNGLEGSRPEGFSELNRFSQLNCNELSFMPWLWLLGTSWCGCWVKLSSCLNLRPRGLSMLS